MKEVFMNWHFTEVDARDREREREEGRREKSEREGGNFKNVLW